jgi:hypothetical protein
MLRRFNYTGRQRIQKDRVTIAMARDASGERTFDAKYQVSALGFPEEARVYVEAYYRYAYMRFSFGTIGCPSVPEDRSLRALEFSSIVYFRLKVVDEGGRHGRLLGVASGIVAGEGATPSPAGRSLLYFNPADLGEEVWRVRFDDEMPVLEVNERIEDARERARSDPGFHALVYPAVLRTILARILIVDHHDDPYAGDDDWRTLWLDFVCRTTGIEPPPVVTDGDAESDYEAWIEDAVGAFCEKHNTCSAFVSSLQDVPGS